MSKKNIKCWWCIYNCNNETYHIPIFYTNKIFHVVGYLCSLNCCVAYILNSNNIRNSSLSLNLLYKLYDKFIDNNKIVPSLPKEILIDFGGSMTYDEYNSNKIKNIHSHIILPPLTCIGIQLETVNSINMDTVDIQLLDKDNINKTKNTLKLKRSKPISYNHLSIEKSLGIFKSI